MLSVCTHWSWIAGSFEGEQCYLHMVNHIVWSHETYSEIAFFFSDLGRSFYWNPGALKLSNMSCSDDESTNSVSSEETEHEGQDVLAFVSAFDEFKKLKEACQPLSCSNSKSWREAIRIHPLTNKISLPKHSAIAKYLYIHTYSISPWRLVWASLLITVGESQSALPSKM